MSASQIPNLLSLRGRGGRRGGRATGSLRDENDTAEAAAERQDKIVQATDTDANVSRLSAVQAGYLQDPFATAFDPSTVPPGGFKRLPIINRGTYARTIAIDRLVNGFLTGNIQSRKQIVSLGAGSDTRFFRLRESGLLKDCIYHELDFPENTRHKQAAIRKSEITTVLLGEGGDVEFTADEIHTPDYHLHAVDLRHLDPGHSEFANRPTLAMIERNIPTLLISECCLTYLKPDTADAVIRYFANIALEESTPRGFVLYEPINPFDAFGKVMVSNLAARGIVLQTLHKYGSLEAQTARMKAYGFASGQGAVDFAYLYRQWIDEAENERISKVEFLDEVEELDMLLKHYCVAWGWSDGGDSKIWTRWTGLKSQPL